MNSIKEKIKIKESLKSTSAEKLKSERFGNLLTTKPHTTSTSNQQKKQKKNTYIKILTFPHPPPPLPAATTTGIKSQPPEKHSLKDCENKNPCKMGKFETNYHKKQRKL